MIFLINGVRVNEARVQLAHNLSLRRKPDVGTYDASHLVGNMVGTGEALKYQAMRVIDRRESRADGIEFLVVWKGFGESDGTWEPESALQGCAALIRDFASKQATASKLKKHKPAKAVAAPKAIAKKRKKKTPLKK
jgi:hypothetical protein